MRYALEIKGYAKQNAVEVAVGKKIVVVVERETVADCFE